MSHEELDFWQTTLDRWKKDAEELMKAPKGPLYGVSYVMGNNLWNLVTQLQKELDYVRKQ